MNERPEVEVGFFKKNRDRIDKLLAKSLNDWSSGKNGKTTTIKKLYKRKEVK